VGLIAFLYNTSRRCQRPCANLVPGKAYHVSSAFYVAPIIIKYSTIIFDNNKIITSDSEIFRLFGIDEHCKIIDFLAHITTNYW